MTFDAGTWWLITIIVTTVVGLVGFLFGRSVFRQLDENRADIKQVRKITPARRSPEGSGTAAHGTKRR